MSGIPKITSKDSGAVYPVMQPSSETLALEEIAYNIEELRKTVLLLNTYHNLCNTIQKQISLFQTNDIPVQDLTRQLGTVLRDSPTSVSSEETEKGRMSGFGVERQEKRMKIDALNNQFLQLCFKYQQDILRQTTVSTSPQLGGRSRLNLLHNLPFVPVCVPAPAPEKLPFLQF